MEVQAHFRAKVVSSGKHSVTSRVSSWLPLVRLELVAGRQLDYPPPIHPQLKAAQGFDKPVEQKLFGL